MLEALRSEFPRLAEVLLSEDHDLENVLPPTPEAEIAQVESHLGLQLPPSYKSFLRVTQGFFLKGGVIQFGSQHPFLHDFPPIETFSEQQRRMIEQKGGSWPPPSQGMLCFAEYFRDADGDQVVFDLTAPDPDGEFPVMYYSHQDRPPSVTRVADSFRSWLEDSCLQDLDEE